MSHCPTNAVKIFNMLCEYSKIGKISLTYRLENFQALRLSTY